MTQLLLDTHTLIWYLHGNPKLVAEVRNHLDNPDNALFISIASFWEIAIKINIGKLNLGCPFPELFTFCVRVSVSERESRWDRSPADNPIGFRILSQSTPSSSRSLRSHDYNSSNQPIANGCQSR
jgi:hypothetical protein